VAMEGSQDTPWVVTSPVAGTLEAGRSCG